MNFSQRNKIIALTAMTFIMIGNPAAAETEMAPQPPTEFTNIMKELGVNMQNITGSISREDWDAVEKEAAKIASHPKPPMSERASIMAFMGANMASFKANDGNTHEAAHAMVEVAASKDGAAIISAFATLQNACLGCHQEFRESFRQHFHAQP